MNFVLGSFLILILLFPGIIFRISYLQGPYSRQTFNISAFDEIAWSLIPTLFLQTSGFIFVEFLLSVFTGSGINLKLMYLLITGAPPALIDFIQLKASYLPFIIYNITLFGLAAIAGFILRKIVLSRKLDFKYRFFRIHNEWYYLFNGHYILPKSNDLEKVWFTQIDALVKADNGDVIYTGALHHFILSKTEGLDRLYLQNVYRRKLSDDLHTNEESLVERDEDERYYKMPGDLFVLKYDQILNLNIHYFYIPGLSEEYIFVQHEDSNE